MTRWRFGISRFDQFDSVSHRSIGLNASVGQVMHRASNCLREQMRSEYAAKPDRFSPFDVDYQRANSEEPAKGRGPTFDIRDRGQRNPRVRAVQDSEIQIQMRRRQSVDETGAAVRPDESRRNPAKENQPKTKNCDPVFGQMNPISERWSAEHDGRRDDDAAHNARQHCKTALTGPIKVLLRGVGCVFGSSQNLLANRKSCSG
jgi:hypothetical protein